MPNIDWNINTWNNDYGWDQDGEEWSAAWGSAFSQWVSTIYPRIASFLPAESILEIAPGLGRWTKFLIPVAKVYRGVDVTSKCVEVCQERFKKAGNAKFYLNDGKSLKEVNDIKYNFVFSFDSLVHADADVIYPYIHQIIRMLADNGAAFIHHSNLGMFVQHEVKSYQGRSTNVTANLVERMIKEAGGHLLTQEIVNWGENFVLNDCFSLFCKSGNYSHIQTRKITSKLFMEQEVNWAKNVIFNYHV